MTCRIGKLPPTLLALRIVALCFLLARPAAAETPAPQTVPSAAPRFPVVTVDPAIFDFGTVKPGQIVTHSFRVSNTGQIALHIRKVEPSCGCTTTVVGKTDLEPGESTEIQATFNPAGLSGTVFKNILISSDDPDRPRAVVRFKAHVVPPENPSLSFHRVDRAAQVRGRVRLPGPRMMLKETQLGTATYLNVYPGADNDGTFLDIVLNGSKLPPDATSGQDTITVIALNNDAIPITIRWDSAK